MMQLVAWLVFFAGIGAVAIAAYAIARYIGQVGRWVLAVIGLFALPAFVSAGFSNEVRGYPLICALAIAAGLAVGIVAYSVRHAHRDAGPQQYLS